MPVTLHDTTPHTRHRLTTGPSSTSTHTHTHTQRERERERERSQYAFQAFCRRLRFTITALISSESEVSKILFNSPNKQCDSDPIPTWLLKECASVIIPTITNIVNLSLSSGHFHPVFKQSVVSPLLKKSTLDN